MRDNENLNLKRILRKKKIVSLFEKKNGYSQLTKCKTCKPLPPTPSSKVAKYVFSLSKKMRNVLLEQKPNLATFEGGNFGNDMQLLHVVNWDRAKKVWGKSDIFSLEFFHSKFFFYENKNPRKSEKQISLKDVLKNYTTAAPLLPSKPPNFSPRK